ncbi:MAG TPA: PEGA domain-containing protein [Polyangiales bacterium]|nr:PEGA domain-containing protein [Polyangiales bacterium]
MRTVGRWIALAAGVWLCGARVAVAQPSDATTARARELFQRGVDAYDRGVYYEALQAFQEAYQLRPHPSVRVNIANCYDKLDRPAEAIQAFEQFLGSGAGSQQQQREVQDALDKLRKRVGRLVLRVQPDGARVVIDNAEERRAPLPDSVLLKAGRHQVSASLDGHETALRVIDIQAEATTELLITLPRLDAPPLAAAAPAPAPPPAAAPAPTPPPAAPAVTLAPAAMAAAPKAAESPGLPATVWIAGGVTVAALMGAIITGQLALAADREFNGDLAAVRNMSLSNAQRAAAWEHGNQAADRAHTYAITTDVLLSTAIVGTVLTTVLYLNHANIEPSATASNALRLRATF